ncbi:conserved Plasmodium protein, unknown function [Plasmodium sp. gorilla clade G3]|nr:conserved Plasmodium protein, unknown function [Plasmodium sp. gorilla clade G3]
MRFLFIYIVLLSFFKNGCCDNELSVKGSLTVANLKISSKNNQENGILFVNEESEYKIGLNERSELIISKKNKPVVTIDEHENLNFFNMDLSVKILNIQGILKIMNVNQFQMFVHEDFSNSSNTKGWTGDQFFNYTSSCGGINLLGGYGKLSKGEIYKTFENIPSHSQIRIKCNFHFIDNWDNQTAYMKIATDEKEEKYYVWTDTHSQINKQNSINICGNTTGESKFFSIIDIIIPHNSNKLIIYFGTNIQKDEPNLISWGISNFQIYII